jgi:hypothetical protein
MPLTSNLQLTKHGVLMIALGTLVCALGSFMARPVREQAGYILAAVLTGACLLIAFRSLGILKTRTMPQGLMRIYLAGGILSIACCMTFWLVQPGGLDIRVLGMLAALLGLFWGSCYMRLAFQFSANSIQSGAFSILAATTFSLGIIMATRSGLSKLGVVTADGCYMILLGVQVYLTAVFLHRQVARIQALEHR